MTTQEILDRTRGLLVNDLDAYTGSEMSDAEILPVANQAQRDIARQILYYNPIQTITASVSDQYRVNLETATGITEPIYEPLRVWYGSDMKELRILRFAEFEAICPSWRKDYTTNTSPGYAIMQEPYLWLYGQVPATNAIYVSGLVYPANMTVSNATPSTSVAPSLPSDLHDGIALRTAIRLSAPIIGEAEAVRRVQTYWQELSLIVKRHYKIAVANLYDDGTTASDYGRYQSL